MDRAESNPTNWLPPLGSPYWLSSDAEALPLIYLSWGTRSYGDHPVFPIPRKGWTYLLFLEGTPDLLHRHKQKKASPGTLVIIPEGLAFGLSDAPRRKSRMISWLWREPPVMPLAPERFDPILHLKLPPEMITRMERLHEDCRREIQVSDAWLSRTLQSYRTLLDTSIARLVAPERTQANTHRIRLAIDWIENHLAVNAAIEKLGEYLSISPATLNRLFTTELQKTPQAYLLHRKMLRAKTLLADTDLQIKAVAYQLNYKHPADFTRRFKAHWGLGPKEYRANNAESLD